MWKKIMLLFVVSFIGTGLSVHAESPWLQSVSLRVTITTEDVLYEWEYENPDKFEYEEGNMIYRGLEAKQSFEELLNYVDLSEPKLTEASIQKLKGQYSGVKRVTMERVDMEQSFQTWLWDENHQ